MIREHCSPEMIERLTGIMRSQKQQVCVVVALLPAPGPLLSSAGRHGCILLAASRATASCPK